MNSDLDSTYPAGVAAMAKKMLALHDIVLDHRNELVDMICSETGKTRADAFAEVMDVAITARFYARRAPQLLKPKKVAGALPVLTKVRVERAPKGVVGIIAPWNYPFTLVLSDAIAALLAGNTVVVKPDTQTEGTARLAEQMMRRAGVSEAEFSLVFGPGKTVGQELAHSCDFLMFTGSTATGRILGEVAGQRLIGYSAELGGKNPMLIDDSANIEKAAAGAVSACFSNAGQLCVSIERIYVVESVYEEFLRTFVGHISNMTSSTHMTSTASGVSGTHSASPIGLQISDAHADRVRGFIKDALEKGASMACGEDPANTGRMVAPTVLTNVPATARLYREEVFGPVVFVEAVPDIATAIRQANDTDYGLNASVWARPDRGELIASKLHAGTVNVNEGYAATWGSIAAPMGGWKTSGLGRRHSDEGLLKYTEARTVATQRLLPIAWLTAHPRLASWLLKIMKRLPGA